MPHKLTQLNQRITACQRCPRLVTYLAQVDQTRRAAYRNQSYWSRPVPNLLPPDPADTRILIVGLAPGAHGANRTGRMFTGDRSGDFLFNAMHHAGLCNQPTSTHTRDGLTLHHTAITAAAHCAPPGNKPTRDELTACRTHLTDTLDALPNLRVIVSLGRIAHDAVLQQALDRNWISKRAEAPFAHAAEHHPHPDAPHLLASYHPSQQNTFTGRLTLDMLTHVFLRAAQHAA